MRTDSVLFVNVGAGRRKIMSYWVWHTYLKLLDRNEKVLSVHLFEYVYRCGLWIGVPYFRLSLFFF